MPNPHDGLSVTETLMYSTVRIVADFPTTPPSNGSGSGSVIRFMYDTPIGKFPFIFVITNKHVVEGATRLTLYLHLQENRKFSGADAFVVDDPQKWIIGHPDPDVDLAAIVMMPFANLVQKKAKEPFFVATDFHQIASEDDLQTFAPGMPVMMIGYPIGLYDTAHNTPLFRGGILASHPGMRFGNRDEFVIDVACFPGSSGSPVWFISSGSYYDKYGDLIEGKRFGRLLGILHAGPTYSADGTITVAKGPITKTNMMINLGYVIRATKLYDFRPIFAERFPELIKELQKLVPPEAIAKAMEAMQKKMSDEQSS